MNIAVTATGGGVGQSIIKALKGHYKVIALNSDPLGAGLYMADKYRIIPNATDDNYIPEIIRICKEEEIDLLFPGMDCELFKLSGHVGVVSDLNVIKIADDKYLTQKFLMDNGLPFIRTNRYSVIAKVWNLDYPCILKPQKGGARSKDVYKLNSQEDMPDNIDMTKYVMQEYIEGDEYTCGTVYLDEYRGCIVMRRILRDGDTYKAFVERNSVIEDLCETICNIIKPFGAFNIQLRMKDGVPYVFEFNARCSGTTAMRALAGFNEPLMIADYLLKFEDPEFDIKEMTILRYWNEIIQP